MTKKNQKGFTLAELVIVITVIAILAAVLIPTFVSLVKKANISNDTTLANNMNTLLKAGATDGVQDMQDVLDIVEEGGISIEKFNPTTEGYRFLWEKVTNQIVFVNEKYEVKYQKDDFKEEKEFWLTVRKQSDIVYTDKIDLNYFLAKDLTGNLELTKLTGFDTGNFELNGTLTIDSEATGTATLNGKIKNVTLDVPNGDVDNYAKVDTMNVQAVADSTLTNYEDVNTLNVVIGNVVNMPGVNIKIVAFEANSTATIQNEGHIQIVKLENMPVAINKKTFVNKGTVSTIDMTGVDADKVTTTKTAINNTEGVIGKTVTVTNNVAEIIPDAFENAEDKANLITNLEELESFRDAVNAGITYEGVTVKLDSNITLNDGWTPIGAFARNLDIVQKQHWGFAGTFDGNGKTITNLNNKGFVPLEAMYNENSSTVEGAKEYAYGLFGCVQNPTIKNLKLADVNIDIPTVAKFNGDSVGAFVGFARNGLTIKDCEALNGSISARDGVGGIVGRTYGYAKKDEPVKTATILDCTNNLTVTGQAKAAGVLGFMNSTITLEMRRCINNGAIIVNTTDDVKVEYAWAAGVVAMAGCKAASVVTACENTAEIKIINATATTNNISAVLVSSSNVPSTFKDNKNTAKIVLNGVEYGTTEATAQALANEKILVIA